VHILKYTYFGYIYLIYLTVIRDPNERAVFAFAFYKMLSGRDRQQEEVSPTSLALRKSWIQFTSKHAANLLAMSPIKTQILYYKPEHPSKCL
jgi:hypothetical protein